jgi:hypothetical protein
MQATSPFASSSPLHLSLLQWLPCGNELPTRLTRRRPRVRYCDSQDTPE